MLKTYVYASKDEKKMKTRRYRRSPRSLPERLNTQTCKTCHVKQKNDNTLNNRHAKDVIYSTLNRTRQTEQMKVQSTDLETSLTSTVLLHCYPAELLFENKEDCRLTAVPQNLILLWDNLMHLWVDAKTVYSIYTSSGTVGYCRRVERGKLSSCLSKTDQSSRRYYRRCSSPISWTDSRCIIVLHYTVVSLALPSTMIE